MRLLVHQALNRVVLAMVKELRLAVVYLLSSRILPSLEQVRATRYFAELTLMYELLGKQKDIKK